ncbi:MAG: hypothetical protein JXA78_18150 [Anaerolineales bacterium]|nr:hypothetical protein [Anaerolineales bacterium]
MDKQEAITIIHRELGNNRSQEEIVALLSQQLGAPADLIRSFVARVVVQEPGSAALPRRQPVTPPAVEARAAPARSVQPAPAPQPASAQAFVGSRSDQAQPDSQTGWSYSRPEFDQEEMEAFILKSLSKSRRQNDVVAIVCERTGLDWGDAQRLVARVASKNRKRLAFRQNLLIIPLALIAILAGLALLYAGVSEAYLMGSSAIADPSALAYSRPEVESMVWAIPTGFILLVGGGFGLYKALKAQFE